MTSTPSLVGCTCNIDNFDDQQTNADSNIYTNLLKRARINWNVRSRMTTCRGVIKVLARLKNRA